MKFVGVCLVTIGQEAIIGFYQKLGRANPAAQAYLPLPECLNKDSYYQINEKETISGHFLMNVGLKKPRLFNGANHTTYQLAGRLSIIHLSSGRKEEMK